MTSYGANPNDGLNDLTAINNAINASSPGDTVVLPAGVFSIAGSITAKSGVAIAGVGRDSTTVRYIGASGSPLVNLGNVSNVEMSRLTLDGNSSVYALQGINAYGGSGHNLHDLAIKNFVANADFGPHGIYFSSGVTNSHIVNNLITNIGTNSIWGSGIRMNQGSSSNQVIGNTIGNTGRGGIFSAGSKDEVIRNNVVTLSGRAAGAPALGIEVWGGSHRALIEGNSVDQWLSVDSSNRVAVRNNTVSGGYIGLEMGTSGSDNIFSGNIVTNAGAGISMSNAGTKERILFANNTISSSSQWGAQIQGGDGHPTIQQLYFYKNTIQGTGGTFPDAGVGLRFNCDAATIQNIALDSNMLTSNNGFGLALGSWPGTNSFRNLQVVNNTIANNKELAVTGSFGGGLAWQLGAPPAGLGLTFAGAAATDNNRNPVSDLLWAQNTLSGNGAGYVGSPWPSDRQNANNQWASTGTFLPGHVPAVSIFAPRQATVGQPVQFRLDYTRGGASPLGNVLWDLGAGLPITTEAASFTYSNPGTYKIGLVVWDSLGRAAHDEVLLTVVPEPPALALGARVGIAVWLGSRCRRRDRQGTG